ncbi:histidine phosphatase family protein [Massilia solisilvae]|uniref:Histidine phosphatase family protein n=1 Tax=Massilia solisilvae TaxID=1811225 RepID=A0ABT2BKL3_9BURK|nr:histidine phosphatase family protein [Massilia solisilvae]MCS0609049.1 histidine phosphatase family protein [Massilia solisilvae]
MELILWRHADAEDGDPDRLRELTPLGHKQAAHLADWLNVRLPEHCRILVSPATRTQQTADKLERDYDVAEAVGPGADPHAVLQAAHWPHAQGAVLVVGHQPTLGRLASKLLFGRAHDIDFPRGAVWWFEQRDPHDDTTLCLKAVMTPDMTLK